MNQTKSTLIVTGITCATVFGIIIHGEMVTDNNRFLITYLGSIDKTILDESFEYPDNPPNVDVKFVEMLPHAQSGWHNHTRPLIVTVLHGELDVYYCTDETANFLGKCHNTFVNHYVTGDVFIEAVNYTHNGKNNGNEPTKMLIVIMSEE